MINLIECLPGEHISAFPARYFTLGVWGGVNAALEALGIQKARIRPHRLFDTDDKRLMEFLQQQGKQLLKERHDLNGYVASFLNVNEQRGIEAEQSIKITGINTLTTNHWRWCAECITEDTQRFGIPYFHRNHQLPGTLHCEKHAVGLRGKCSHCGFMVDKLGPVYLPPRHNQCHRCDTEVPAYNGYVSEAMKAIERISIGLAEGQLRLDLSEMQTYLLQQIGVGLGELDTRAGKYALQQWHLRQTKAVDTQALHAYFRNVKPTKHGVTSPLQKAPRLYRHTPNPLHPLAHLVSLYYAGYDFKNRSHEPEQGALMRCTSIPD